ncbi:MAG: DnaA regulatory inactivator Hda [Gammaproteobacteria bacterium]|nr:DnaA regulatory inactivator Hda [Gammaproteobacteria bacterium]MDH5650974.1 DnaA regulatory inactivator Hda [Gammaproteobacteria bacterium]
MASLQQLPLALQLRDSALLENFIIGGNENLLYNLCNGSEQYIYLWGEQACGKSHLLQALCHRAGIHGLTSAYLPLGHAELNEPDILDGLESLDLICLDELEHIAGDPDWEVALFHLINRLRDAGKRLVIAARHAPGKLGIGLPDLESRLNWGVIYQLATLGDADKLIFLQERAAQRGLQLGNDVAEFLLKRYPRDMASLFELLDRLDKASLAAQRKLTIPFVREFL